MTHDRNEALCAVATAIGTSMIERCAGAPETGRVSLPVGDFRKVADVLLQMRAAAAAPNERRGLDADGFRFWLPLAEVEALNRALEAVRRERDELSERLRLHALSI